MKLGWEATGSRVMCEGSPYTPPAIANTLGYLQHHLQELTKHQNASEHTINATLAGLTALLEGWGQMMAHIRGQP